MFEKMKNAPIDKRKYENNLFENHKIELSKKIKEFMLNFMNE